MTTLRIVYTAPNKSDVGQQTAAAILGGAPPVLEAAGHTTLAIDHPPGQRLRLLSPSLRAEDTDTGLVVFLPDDDQLLDLAAVAQPSGTNLTIKVTIKKGSIKPEPPRQATFRR